MSLIISDVQWKYTRVQPVDGSPATDVKGGMLAATFTCTCGKVWKATGTQDLQPGHFYETYSSITAVCPGCQQQLHVKRTEYAHL